MSAGVCVISVYFFSFLEEGITNIYNVSYIFILGLYKLHTVRYLLLKRERNRKMYWNIQSFSNHFFIVKKFEVKEKYSIMETY